MLNLRFPPEMVDNILDFLHNDIGTLEQCSLVSKSWFPRSRKLLFTNIEFYAPADIEGWKRTFPNISNSPAQYTRTLSIYCPEVITVDDAAEGGWISAFSHVACLKLDNYETAIDDDPVIRPAPFFILSPTLKSLHISSFILSDSQAFNFIHSLPLLEDLTLISDTVIDDAELNGPQAPIPPSTLSPFTGKLELGLPEGMGGVTRRLLSPPNRLHFRELKLAWHERGPGSITGLIEACLPTLEYLDIAYKLEEPTSFPVDLGKATNLKGVVLRSESLNCRWMSMVVKSLYRHNLKNFRQASIHLPSRFAFTTAPDSAIIEAQIKQLPSDDNWSTLSCHLSSLRSAYKILTKIVCPRFQTVKGGRSAEDWVRYMFPGVGCCGPVEIVRE